MVKGDLKQTSAISQAASFVKSHQFIIGLLLVFFCIGDLVFILPNLYGMLPHWWVSWQIIYFYMPEWIALVPALFIFGLVGTLILSVYCITDIQPNRLDDKEHAAVLVAGLGFTYQVVGAWPFWNQSYPWPWQMQIARYGNLLILPLFAGSLIALIVGATSLYLHSRIYHQKNTGITA